MRTRQRVYKMEKSEDYFKRCNNWQASQKRTGRVREVLSLCDVTNDQVNDIMDAAVSIWTRLKLPRIKPINLNVVKTREGLAKAKTELRQKFPAVFLQHRAGVQEQKFLHDTAPEAVFYCVNAGTDVQEMQRVLITTQSTRESAPQGEDAPSEENDAAVEDEKGRTTVSTGQQSLKVTLKVGEHELRRFMQNRQAASPQSLPKKKQPQTERGRLKEIKVVDLTEVKEENEAAASKEILSKIPAYEHSTAKRKSPSSDEESREDKPPKRVKSTPHPATQPDQPFFIEILSAKTKSILLQLELKHLAEQAESPSTPSFRKLEEQVKQWPYSTWPAQLVFIHVTLETKLNVPIFSQGMLDTAFEDWRRKGHDGGTRSNWFRMYANDHDGPLLMITDT